MTKTTSLVLASAAVLAGTAVSANAQTVAIATFGERLFRAQLDGTVEEFQLSDRIISATATSSGSITMFSQSVGPNGREAYTLNDALGTPSLNLIRDDIQSQVASGVTEIDGQLFGSNGNDFFSYDATTFASTLVGSHNIAGDPADNGVGGLGFDASTGTLYGIARNDNLYTIDFGTGNATLVGTSNIDMFNTGAEFFAGRLFAAVFDETTSLLSFGTIDTSTAAFTAFASVDLTGQVDAIPQPVSLVVVPAPAGAAVLGLAGLAVARRRR